MKKLSFFVLPLILAAASEYVASLLIPLTSSNISLNLTPGSNALLYLAICTSFLTLSFSDISYTALTFLIASSAK